DAGHLQLEVGLADGTFLRHGGEHEDIDVYAAPALRYGLTPRLEFEASTAPAIVDAQRGEGRQVGVGDTTFGLMGALTDPDGKGPAVSLNGFVTGPTATHGLGNGGWTGGLRLPVAGPLGDSLSYALMPEVDVLRDADGGGTHLAWTAVGGLSRAFGPLSLGTELWGQIEDAPEGRITRATADLTAAVMTGPAMQLDAGAAIGLNRQTPDLELYVGVARRF
ncbi:MAG: hypothetical protein BGN86_07055, partial [Caulobacterales bacterium 68-7]